jgi:hypothetical protein
LPYWDLSTSHVTPTDLGLIYGSELLTACGYPEGAFVSLDPDLLAEAGEGALAREGFSPGFVSVVGAALAAGVHLVRFDADAPRYAALVDAGRSGAGGDQLRSAAFTSRPIARPVVWALIRHLESWQAYHGRHMDPAEGCDDNGAEASYGHVIGLLTELSAAVSDDEALALLRRHDEDIPTFDEEE